MEEVLAVMQNLQAGMNQMQADHQTEKDRLSGELTTAAGKINTLEATVQMAADNLVRLSAANDAMAEERRQSLEVLKGLPVALKQLADSSKKSQEGKALMDNRGLGKPYVLGDTDPDGKFRMWAIRVEDFVSAVYGETFREIMAWAAEQEGSLDERERDDAGAMAAENRLEMAYGIGANPADKYDDLIAENSQFYSALRTLTEGTPFTYVDNAPSGNGLEAWRALHAKYDPATGGRKKAMLNALIRPTRATQENLAGALERWKSMRNRYEQKKDQHGRRESLPDSVAMNSLEQLVPKEIQDHLLLNQSRLKTFMAYETEIRTYIEAKHGGAVKITTDFSKDDGGVQAMDVGSLNVFELASMMKGGKGSSKGGKGFTSSYNQKKPCYNCGKDGHLAKDCRSPNKGKGKGAGGQQSSKIGDGKGCFNCGGNHLKKDCRKPGGGAHDPSGGSKGGKGKGKDGKGGKKGKGKGKGKKGINAWDVEQEEQSWWTEEGEELCGFERLVGGLERVTPPPPPHPQQRPQRRQADLAAVDEVEDKWLKCNFDTGAADTAIPRSQLGPDAVPTETQFRTASGEIVNGYGQGTLSGEDEHGWTKKLKGEFTDVHKSLVSASAVH